MTRHPDEYKTIEPKTFYECDCCGGFHWTGLPGSIDCRDNAHRFNCDELDALYGATNWNEISLEEQLRDEESEDNESPVQTTYSA